MKASHFRFMSLALCGLGLVISGYLLTRHFALVGGEDGASSDVCSALFGKGCDEALQSPIATRLGISLAGWGVVYYILLAAILISGRMLREAFEFEAGVAAIALSVVGALGSIILGGLMAIGKAPFCPMCAAVHLINLSLTFCLKGSAGCSWAKITRGLAAAVAYVLGRKTSEPANARWKVVAFLAMALLVLVLYQWVLIQEIFHQRGPFDPAQVLAAFEASPRKDIPITESDATIGDRDAPVRLVVFSDFQCPSCTEFSTLMADLVERAGGALQVVFKHFPLSTTCNTSVEIDVHPGACQAAWAARAAHRQGKFWAYHDALFHINVDPTEKEVTTYLALGPENFFSSIARDLNLDLERFEADRVSETVLAGVQGDIDLGIELGVDFTPAIFINDRLVYDRRPRALRLLIEHMTAKRNPPP